MLEEQYFTSLEKLSYPRRKRKNGIHLEMRNFSSASLEKLLDAYHESNIFEGELRRQMRDIIRRYQEFVIQDNFKAHYIEISESSTIRFEHAIPVTQITDFLIKKKITTLHALDAPAVLLSADSNAVISSHQGNFNSTPWRPFLRYVSASNNTVKLKTIFDEDINLEAWTLKDHYGLVEKLWNENHHIKFVR